MWYYNYSEFYPGPLASPITQTSNIIMNTSTPHRKAMDMHAKPSLYPLSSPLAMPFVQLNEQRG